MEVITGKQVKAQRIVIYGPEGIGKSTLASKFPKPIFIDTEGSTNELDVERLAKPSSWNMLKEQIKWASQQDYQTIIVDTVDWAERLCIEHICALRGMESLGGAKDYGQSYNMLYMEWSKLLNYLVDLSDKGINIVLLAHAQQRRTDLPNEMDSYDRWELKMEKKTSASTKEWSTMVLFINYKTIIVESESGKPKAKGGQRVMYTSYHPCWDAKNRVGLPDECKLDYSILSPFIPTLKTISQEEIKETKDIPKQEFKQPEQKEVKKKVKEEVQEDEERAAIQSDDIINKNLADLMVENNITEDQIRAVVAGFGIYPLETPINNYGEKFINGGLVADWESVMKDMKTKGII